MILTRRQLSMLIESILSEESPMHKVTPGSRLSSEAAASLVSNGFLSKENEGKASWLIGKLEDKSSKLQYIGKHAGTAGTAANIAYTIALFHAQSPEKALAYGTRTFATDAAELFVAQKLGEVVGLGTTLSGMLIAAAVSVPVIFVTEMAKLYDPFERIMMTYNNKGNKTKHGAKRPLQVGKQIEVPVKSSSISNASIRQNPLYGLMQMAMLGRNHRAIEKLMTDDIITTDTFHFIMEPYNHAQDVKKLNQYAESLQNNPEMAGSSENFQKITSLVRHYYNAVSKTLRKEGAKRHKFDGTDDQSSERMSRFIRETRKLGKAIKEKTDASPTDVRSMIDKLFVNNRWKGHKNSLGGNPPGLGSYLFWHASADGDSSELKGMLKEYNTTFPSKK